MGKTFAGLYKYYGRGIPDMTNDQVIISLLCCLPDSDCTNCPYKDEEDCEENLLIDVLDLINRQNAEIERLKEIEWMYDDLDK